MTIILPDDVTEALQRKADQLNLPLNLLTAHLVREGLKRDVDLLFTEDAR